MNLKRMILGGVLTAATFAILMGAVIDLGSMVSFGANTNIGNVIANVGVQQICSISVSNSVVNFGSLGPGQNVATLTVITATDNGGNFAGSLTIQAGVGNTLNTFDGNSVWLGTSAANSIGISNTVFSLSYNTLWASGTAVGSFVVPTPTGGIVPAPTQTVPSQSNTIYVGMRIPSGTPADTYSANILLETTC